jgi:hypothetical protein
MPTVHISANKTPRFATWLKSFSKEDNPRGDVARDAKMDPSFPSGGYEKTLAYLVDVGAADIVLEIVEEAWVDYKEEHYGLPSVTVFPR